MNFFGKYMPLTLSVRIRWRDACVMGSVAKACLIFCSTWSFLFMPTGVLSQPGCDSMTIFVDDLMDEYQPSDDVEGYLDCIGKSLGKTRGIGQECFVDWIDFALEQLWRSPATEGEEREYADLLLNKGYYLETVFNDLVEAKKCYDIGAEIHSGKLKLKYFDSYAFARHSLANIYSRFGDYSKSVILLSDLIDAWDIKGQNDPYFNGAQLDLVVALIYTDQWSEALSILHGLEPVDQRMEHYKTMLEYEIYFKLQNYPGMFDALHHASDLLRRLDSTQWMRPTFEERKLHLVEYYTRYYRSLGDHERAERYMDQALRLVRSVRQRKAGKLYNYCAEVFLSMGESQKARVMLDSALKKISGLDDLPDTLNFFPENTLLETLTLYARYHVMKFHSSGEIDHLRQALACYKRAIAVEGHLRYEFDFSESKHQLQEFSKGLYASFVSTAGKIFEINGDSSLLWEAFTMVEKNRALILREKYFESRFLRDSTAWLDHEKYENARNQYIHLSRQWMAHKTGGNVLGYDSIALKKELQWAELKYLEEKRNLFYQGEKGEGYQAENLDFIPSFLTYLERSHATFLEFFIHDTLAFSFCVQNGKLRVRHIREVSKMENMADSLSLLLRMDVQSEDQKNKLLSYMRSMGCALMPDTLGSDRVVVSPDAWLHGLPPFFYLSCGRSDYGNPWDVQAIPCLSLAYSARALMERQSSSGVEDRKKVLYIHPTDFSDFKLPKLRDDADKISRVLGDWQMDVLSGRDCNRANIFGQCGEYDLLHFNTHVRTEGGVRLFLQGEVLQKEDIETLRLKARLAVISACQSGHGQVSGTEGPMSIARSFALAGVSSCIMTLWDVDVGSTQVIINGFYEYLVQGLAMDVALQKAKMDYLSQAPGYATAPYFWAGIILIGDSGGMTVENEGHTNRILMIIGACFMLSILGWMIYLRGE